MIRRFTVEAAIKHKLLHGDLPTIRDGGRVYLPYDKITVERASRSDSLELSIMSGKVVIASVDISLKDLISGSTIFVEQLEGRMELLQEPSYHDKYDALRFV